MSTPDANQMLTLMRERRSIRAFLPDSVPLETVMEILDASGRAPSGTNTQPWRVHVVIGDVKQQVTDAVIAAARANDMSQEYPYGPERWFEPYKSRRREVGFALYDLKGIAKDDMEGRFRQHIENYRFFGAPVGLFFTIDRQLEKGSWIDVGLYMQNVMLAARAVGLETCPQACWLRHGKQIRNVLGIPDDQVIVSGMSLGHEDTTAIENTLRTTRVPASDFTTVHGA